MSTQHTPEPLYQNVDVMALDRVGNYYCKHIMAMTAEGLHSKSDIAAQLGIRDLRIKQAEQQRDELQKRLDAINAQKPAAYMHNDGITVISNPVRDLWRGADPRRVENYTIPLFAKAQGAV
jgi:hypothetical protein